MRRILVGTHTVSWLLLALLVNWQNPATSAEPAGAQDHVVIDGVRVPLDKSVEIVGTCQTTDSFQLRLSYARAVLLGLRIDGRANQEGISFHLIEQDEKQGETLEDLEEGAYYKVVGRIGGARLSGPNRICNFEVEQIEKIPPAPLGPQDFEGRVAEFEGTAIAGGAIDTGGETIRLEGSAEWPQQVAGKKVSVRGEVTRGESGWQFSNSTWKLVELADMIDQQVTLEGTLLSLNDHWWFEYRDESLYLTSDEGPQFTFRGRHGSPATVRGKLVRQLRPSLDQITLKNDRDLVETYVVRGAKIEFPAAPVSWSDRFGPVYSTRHEVSEGVPLLLAESSLRKNMLGNETTARLFAERNSEAIRDIVREASPETQDVLARRMEDAEVDPTLRLLYASILCRMNDARGREFLLESLELPEKFSEGDVFYCLGMFPYLGDDADTELVTECDWVESTLIEIMRSEKKGELAALVSSIPTVLLQIGTPGTRAALLDYALKHPGDPSGFLSGPSVAALLCDPAAKCTAEELLQLEAVVEDQGVRRSILRALLRLKHPAAAERFAGDLEEGFVYMDFRDGSSPEVMAALKPRIPELEGKARAHGQMLVVLGNQDPVPPLLTLLDDANFEDKNLVLFELARIADPRAVPVVAKLLRESPNEALDSEEALAPTISIRHALDVIAKPGTRETVQELIGLLGTDLGRYGGYIDQAGWQRIVAAHLIEITGESFGVDQTAWQAWEEEQPDERFRAADRAKRQGESFRTGPDARVDLNR